MKILKLTNGLPAIHPSEYLQYWLNLQNAYDLKVAQAELKDSLLAVKKLAEA